MERHIVSYEQAQKLKELGFDCKCDHHWHEDFVVRDKMTLSDRQTEEKDYNNDDWVHPHCSAPYLDQVVQWLREVKGVHVIMKPKFNHGQILYTSYVAHYDWGRPVEMEPSDYCVAQSSGVNKALNKLEEIQSYADTGTEMA